MKNVSSLLLWYFLVLYFFLNWDENIPEGDKDVVLFSGKKIYWSFFLFREFYIKSNQLLYIGNHCKVMERMKHVIASARFSDMLHREAIDSKYSSHCFLEFNNHKKTINKIILNFVKVKTSIKFNVLIMVMISKKQRLEIILCQFSRPYKSLV